MPKNRPIYQHWLLYYYSIIVMWTKPEMHRKLTAKVPDDVIAIICNYFVLLILSVLSLWNRLLNSNFEQRHPIYIPFSLVWLGKFFLSTLNTMFVFFATTVNFAKLKVPFGFHQLLLYAKFSYYTRAKWLEKKRRRMKTRKRGRGWEN